jgi:hypothetical protein
VSDAWYSPSYGVRQPCFALDLTVAADVTPGLMFEFAISRVHG